MIIITIATEPTRFTKKKHINKRFSDDLQDHFFEQRTTAASSSTKVTEEELERVGNESSDDTNPLLVDVFESIEETKVENCYDSSTNDTKLDEYDLQDNFYEQRTTVASSSTKVTEEERERIGNESSDDTNPLLFNVFEIIDEKRVENCYDISTNDTKLDEYDLRDIFLEETTNPRLSDGFENIDKTNVGVEDCCDKVTDDLKFNE